MSVIDLNIYNSLKESTGADFISELADAFIEDAYTQMAAMQTALPANDAETFRRAAHSLKSNAATFGATDLASLAGELEMLGREKNLAVGSKLKALKDAFELVKSRLNELRNL